MLIKRGKLVVCIKIRAKESLGYEQKKNELWFLEGCSKLLDQRTQAKQWLEDPSEMNGVNLYNIRHETSRQFSKGVGANGISGR
jgi:hypothetical protein